MKSSQQKEKPDKNEQTDGEKSAQRGKEAIKAGNKLNESDSGTKHDEKKDAEKWRNEG